jgi:putative lipoic acid-binding regulatory protein
MAKSLTDTDSALALLDYPNRYPLKVFGKKSSEFETVVLDLVKARCPQSENIEVSKRESKKGKYLALTLTFTAYSQQQIEEIYRDLYDCDDVVMSL